MEEQHQRFEKIYGISSIAPNSNQDIYASDLKNLASGNYRAIFMTPEIILDSLRLKGLWSLARWRQNLQTIVIDEIHCVAFWRKDFRRAYGQLKLLRSMVLPTVAFVAIAATLLPPTLDETIKSVGFKPNVPIHNFGNNRDNIMLEMRLLPRTNRIQALDVL
ncbi:ATP-dependent DNA helicase sgs1, partial [Dissophora globulifera]